jgi:hypothetical protein
MKLYRENRIDGEWDIPNDVIAEKFWQRYPDGEVGMQLDRALRGFIGDPEGLNSSWNPDDPAESAAYYEVLEETLAAWPK